MTKHWSRMKCPIGVAALLGICSLVASAQDSQPLADPSYYSFYPSSPLHLGAGFNPNDVSQSKVDCISFTPKSLDNDATLTTSLSQSIVLSTDQLKQTLSIDSKIDASYLSFNGGATFNYVSDSLFSDNSLTVVITASSEYGRLGVDSPKLRPEYAHLLADAKQFESVCGSRFVDIERRGASVSVILTIYGLSKEDHDNITSALSGGGGWGPFSADVAASLSQDIKRASQSNELQIQVVATGGTGLSGLADLVRADAPSDDAIDKIKDALATFLQGFSAPNAAPIGFHVTDMSFAGWNPSAVDLWTDYKETILRKIVADYRATASVLQDANGILAGTDPRRAIVPQANDKAIQTLITAYTDRLMKLAQADSACKADTTTNGSACIDPTFPDVPNPIPKSPRPPVMRYRVMGWTILQNGNAGSSVDWDPIRSRAFMGGTYLYKYSQVFPWPSDDKTYGRSVSWMDWDARLKSLSLVGTVYVEVDDPDQVFQNLSVKIQGSPDYQDIGMLGNICCFLPYRLGGQVGGITSLAASYIFNDLQTFNKVGTVEKAATFAIHVTDKLGRSYYLPFATGRWQKTINPIPPGACCSNPFNTTITLNPVL